MKKLNLVLLCLACIALMGSCKKKVENPQPTIKVLEEDGYVKDGDVVDENATFKFGFVMASNAETGKELKSLSIKVGDEAKEEIINLSGKDYTYRDSMYFQVVARDVIGDGVITATVTDVDNEVATASINLSINEAEEPLAEGDFDWYRLGSAEESGLEQFGLDWEMNAKSPFAQIKPLSGVVLYKFDSNVWDEVITETQKVAKFADGATTASVYNNVDVNQNGMYDDVIGTRMPDGTLYLLHVTSCVIGAQQSAGRPIHIYGNWK